MEYPREKWSLYWLARNKPYINVLVSGVLLALSFPPFPTRFLIFIAFIPIFFLFDPEIIPVKVPEDKVFNPFKFVTIVFWRLVSLQFLWRRKLPGGRFFIYKREKISGNAQLFRYTYGVMLIWFAAGYHWMITESLHRSSFAGFISQLIAACLIILILPAFYAVSFQFYSRIRHVFPAVLATFMFIPFWISSEIIQSHLDINWPWLLIGNSLGNWPELIQFAEFTGSHGISFYILTANVLFYYLLRKWFITNRLNRIVLVVSLMWILLPVFSNILILNPSREIFSENHSIKARIITMESDSLSFEGNTNNVLKDYYSGVTRMESLDSIDLVIFPGKAFPRPIVNFKGIRDTVFRPFNKLCDSLDIAFMGGFDEKNYFEEDGEGNVLTSLEDYVFIGGKRKLMRNNVFHSVFLLKRGYTGPDLYRNMKPIPMLERTPFPELLGIIHAPEFMFNTPLGPARGGSYSGCGEATMLSSQDDIPFAAMTAYEGLSPEYAPKFCKQDPEALFIFSDDQFWLEPAAPAFYKNALAIRAIECRKTVVYSTNSGDPVVVSPTGFNLPINGKYFYDIDLPLSRKQTVFVKNKARIEVFWFSLSIFIVIISIIKNQLKKKKSA